MQVRHNLQSVEMSGLDEPMPAVADQNAIDLAAADDGLFEMYEEADEEVDDWAYWYELEWVLYNGEYWTEFQGYWYRWGQVHIYQNIHEHCELLVVAFMLINYVTLA